MGKFHDDKLHRLFQCEFRQNVHDFLPLYMRWSDVNDATVITRRHVGGMLKVNKGLVKMRKSAKILILRARILTVEIQHTTACKRTYVYDVTLLRRGIHPTCLPLQTEWRHCYLMYRSAWYPFREFADYFPDPDPDHRLGNFPLS